MGGHVKFAVNDDPEVLGMGGGVGVVPSSVGHQVESHGEVLFPKIIISVLSVFSFRQLVFIQSAISVMQALNLIRVLGVLSVRERMSCVLLV